jgi:hypothetical protein
VKLTDIIKNVKKVGFLTECIYSVFAALGRSATGGKEQISGDLCRNEE